MLNRVMLVGRITHDLELKNGNKGTPICNFSLAVDNRTKNEDGSRTASFINCVAFSKNAENMVKFLFKGSLIGVDGKLFQRKFTKKDGTNGNVIEVLCDNVEFLDSHSEKDNTQTVEEYDRVENVDAVDFNENSMPF